MVRMVILRRGLWQNTCCSTKRSYPGLSTQSQMKEKKNQKWRDAQNDTKRLIFWEKDRYIVNLVMRLDT